MDQALLKELAHFKLLLKKTASHSTDIEKLLSDKAYGKQVLSLAEESDNEELILMALDLKDKLGLLPQPGKAVETKPAENEVEEKPQDKYKFGARG
jgi:hypothetical protein